MTTQWLVIDFDGVIRHWDIQHFAETAHDMGLSAREFATIALSDELLPAAMIGDLTAEEWYAEVGRRVAERHGCPPASAAEAFAQLRWSIDAEVVDLVREVRTGERARDALFSNASTNLESDLAQCELDSLFHHVANSSRIKMVKPDPAAFRHVAGLLGVDAGACLFVDDLEPNVAGARQAGMRAERFVSAEELRSLLVHEGLIV